MGGEVAENQARVSGHVAAGTAVDAIVLDQTVTNDSVGSTEHANKLAAQYQDFLVPQPQA